MVLALGRDLVIIYLSSIPCPDATFQGAFHCATSTTTHPLHLTSSFCTWSIIIQSSRLSSSLADYHPVPVDYHSVWPDLSKSSQPQTTPLVLHVNRSLLMKSGLGKQLVVILMDLWR